MYSQEEYKYLKAKYGPYASWAIWDKDNEKNTSIIDRCFDQLSPKHVFIGLNISAPLRDYSWANFRGGRHDRKLKYACNDTDLRGSYLTDLFKGVPEAKSFKVKGMLNDNIIKENVSFFQDEMNDIGLTKESILVLLGDLATQYFDEYFQKLFDNPIISYRHYSSYGTDRDWVEGLWKELDINGDVESIIGKYRR
ncbi:MAG: hypothetical protein WDZ88_02435 [Candidatus Paceibacterota bacterium]